MIPFLKETAKSLLDSGRELNRLRVVLPNRRAGLFFTKYMGELIEQPVWMPEVITIEQLVYELAGKTPTDDLTLIFELYEQYCQIQKEPESFDRFYHWGELILKDFNDLDQFLAPVAQVYSHLAEIKSLETDLSYLSEEQRSLIAQFWKAFERQNEREQERFLRFWQVLGKLYEGFQARLHTGGFSYSGQLYRQVAQQAQELPVPEKEVLFIGFNAFTQAEEKIISHFIQSFGAQLIWDVDAYYLEDSMQEAGLFFRQYRKDKIFGKTFPSPIPNQIRNKSGKVHIHAIPLKTNQANLVGQLLEEQSVGEALEETVIILPDEHLLFPVLDHLPERITDLNVTMGYPMRNAPMYAFLDALLELQKHAKVKDEKIFFYHKTVLDLLAYAYLNEEDPLGNAEVIEKIKTNNLIEVPQEAVAKESGLFALVFQKIPSQGILDYLASIITFLAKEFPQNDTQKNYLFQAFKQLNRMKEIFHSQNANLTLDFQLNLFRKLFRELKLPFEGEPLRGLQIMGVLESRNLDFKRVIICDVNEGSFPPAAGMNSMIPMNLRKAFGLPVQEQNDAIYAYTFYRLLHRAEEVHLIYSTAGEQGKATEMSRYLHQLRVELQVNEANSVWIPVQMTPPSAFSIEKTEAVMDKLTQYLVKEGEEVKTFSASALNMYLDCRLRFYFRYVAQLKEKEEVVTYIDPMTFGTLLHRGMEHLYAIPEGRTYRDLDKKDIEQLIPQVQAAVTLALREFYKVEEGEELRLSGQLVIASEVLAKYLEAILTYDKNQGKFRVIGLEEECKAKVSIQTAKGIKEVALGGVIDRMDIKEGVVRLLDYKTGKDTKVVGSISSLFDREDKKRNKAAMQTFLYAFFYHYMHPENQLPIKPGIFNIKEIYAEDFNLFLQMDKTEILDYRDHAAEFEEGLRKLIEEILNPDLVFDQTLDKKKCTYCAYKEICGR